MNLWWREVPLDYTKRTDRGGVAGHLVRLVSLAVRSLHARVSVLRHDGCLNSPLLQMSNTVSQDELQ